MRSPDAGAAGANNMSQTHNAVELRKVLRRFGDRKVLNQIDLTLRASEFVAVLGPSGTGKTTLLRILSGLDQADGGSVRLAASRSVVFQEPRLVPAKKVWENVVLGESSREAQAAALRALEEVGLTKLSHAWPKTLSGGEAQRVALARALVHEPKLLLLDEPFASLDALTRIRMHELVQQLWARHQPAVVLVTHDVDEAILLADRVLVLSNGQIALDVQVNLPKPRRKTHPEFDRLRTQLLLQLGVTVPREEALAGELAEAA
ncbi:ABC transporter ATP-binding protein [Polaromonas sp. YR568]|uniref:ABC transporter ATP-binding protein n=1 Tax=Polaromonas sp. YR568 TaxID=1855301 RepID=UPI00398BE5E3